MKIHTRKLPYEEVLKLPRLQHKKPRKPSRFLATVVRIACIPTLWSTPLTMLSVASITFVLSALVCLILARIPVIGKWLVG